MPRLVCACVLAALLGACVTAVGLPRNHQTSKVLLVAGSVVAGAGLAYVAYNDPKKDIDDVVVMGLVVMPGGLLALEGAAGLVVHDDPDDAHRRGEAARAAEREAAQARARNRDRAWLLTKEAAAEARAGRCAQVAVFDREVRASDPDLHASTFARDVAIQRCLAPTQAAPDPVTPGQAHTR